MPEETVHKEVGPRKRLAKSQAIATMVAGGVLVIFAWFAPAEQGTTLHLAKVGVGLLGFAAVCVGAYYRP